MKRFAMTLVCLLGVGTAWAWGNHTLPAYRTFEKMPEVVQAANVTAEPLEAFLKTEEKTVTEIVTALGASKANVSQHLAVMRHKGILTSRREGVNIYYRVSNPKVIDACALMKEVLFEQNSAKGKAITGT